MTCCRQSLPPRLACFLFLLLGITSCNGFAVTSVVLPVHRSSTSTSRIHLRNTEDHLCDVSTSVEFSEASLTSTFSAGTPESEIVLSWEADVAAIIREKLMLSLEKSSATNSTNSQKQPFIVGLVGNPGSGKTTSCMALSELLSDLGCLVMPFDGYHYSMAELESRSNADDLIYRRGAPDTFDAVRLQRDLKRIRGEGEKEQTVTLPGFDHEKGDPEPDQHTFDRDQHKIVLCEGLYLLHDDKDVWKETKNLLDYSVFVNADVELCMERLMVRNLCIPGYTEEEIIQRCEQVDRANAMTVERSKVNADIVVDSAAVRSITTTISDGTPESDIEVSWEADVAAKIRKDLAARPTDRQEEPYMLSVVGGPGCGKTTSCFVLSEMLSDLGCMVMPFDGYHLPIAELQTRDDADDLIYRRGAPETFDAARLRQDLMRIKSGKEPTVSVPGFDHAVGDPEEDAHCFDASKHKVVLCEGLYLLHDDAEWNEVKNLFEYSIFVNADVDACIERLKVRNKCIPGYTEQEIEVRCETVDRVNAETVDRSKHRADLVVASVAQEQAMGLTIEA